MGFIDMDKPCSEGMNKDDCGFITFVQVYVDLFIVPLFV